MNKAQSKQRILSIWLPHWPLERLASVRPELKRRELVLYEQYHRGLFRVAACSGRHGITVGMPLAEAAALANVHFEEHDSLADQAALVKLAGWCEQFSPIVGVEEPDNLLLDVTGLAPIFGGEEALVEQVARAFQRLGLTLQIGLADTVGAAWAIAHWWKELAVITAPGKTPAALSALPIAALRLPEDIVQTLAELGIQQIGQLLALPRDALAARFDPQLLKRLDQALGLIPETICSRRPPPEFFSQMQLEYPLINRAGLEHVLAQLLEQISGTLVQHQHGAIQLECDLQCETGSPLQFVVSLYRASANAQHLLELLRQQLERLVLPGPISSVKLLVLTSAPLASWQQELFEEKSRHESQRQLTFLVDRLSNCLGREAVVQAMLLADAQPEFAFRYKPLAGSLVNTGSASVDQSRLKTFSVQNTGKPSGARRKPSSDLTPAFSQKEREHNLRPLRLETEPIPLEVLSVVPYGPPIQFSLHGHRHRVARAWGPERIQTGWWRGRYVQRDYYRVETAEGNRFWLFRRLSDEKWFLHGVFE